MRTIDYLLDPSLRGLYWPGVVVGLEIALMGSALSVLVVLKRLSFIGQGISHAAFGGVGVAAVAGLTGTGAAVAAAQTGVVTLFCLASAVAIALISRTRSVHADTAIGIVLVGSMALGALLLHSAHRLGRGLLPAWDSILFGSLWRVGATDALVGAFVTVAVLAALWWSRRTLLFWAFDEKAAPAFGVNAQLERLRLTILLALAIVAAMKLAGVVLATAVVVLPGAAALQLSQRFAHVLVWSAVLAVIGVSAGLVASFELDVQSGPSIVLAMAMLFGLSAAAGPARRRLRRAAPA